MSNEDFVAEVEQTVAVYEETTGRPATRTRQMIERHGAASALARLVISPSLQQGFKALRDSNQLKQSFEALVLRHSSLFTAEVVAAAKWRLGSCDKLL